MSWNSDESSSRERVACSGSTWVQYSCGHYKIFVIYKTGFYNQNNRNGVREIMSATAFLKLIFQVKTNCKNRLP